MKKTITFFRLLPVILLALLLTGSGVKVWGQTTIFSVAGGGTLPTGWTATDNITTNPIDKSTYYLLDAGNPSDILITSNYDISTYSVAEFKVDITSFGTGSYTPLKVEVSYDGGTSYTQTATTVVTTSSYVTQTIPLNSISSQVKLRLSVGATTGRGIRLQKLILNATPTPTKLAITSISPATPTSGSTFNVTVQAQDGSGVAGNVTANTAISLSNTGGGTIGGTTTGTINAGSSSVTISGVILSGSGTGVTLTATATSGDALTAGTSAAFTVLAVKPTVASAVTAGTKTANSIPLTWTSGDGAGRIVVARLNATTAVPPTAGTAYTANSASFTDGTNSTTGTNNIVVYNGTENSVTVTGLTAATAYNFDVYEYNGTTGTYNYSAAASAGSTSTLATEPTAQATTLTFTNVTATGMTIGCTAGTGGSGRIFVLKAGSAVDFVPVDGTTYTANLNFTSGTGLGTNSDNKVVAVTGTSANVTGLTSNTTYYVAVYELNGSSTTINYLTTSPLTGNQLTLPTAASAVTVSNRTPNSMDLSWTNGSGTGRIVVARATSSTLVAPTNGTSYTVNSNSIADALNGTTGTGNVVVYKGTGKSTTITGLTAGTQYQFYVYEYNSVPNYATAAASAATYTLAAEPTTKATIGSFSSVTATGFTVNFTLGTDPGTSRVILVKSGSAVDGVPEDATSYTTAAFGSGTQIGTGNYVVYSGSATTNVTVTGLSANTTYHVAVFEFNGTGGNINYLTTSPATGNQLTLVTAPAAPTALTFGSVTYNSFTASFTAPGTAPDGYLVVRRKTTAISGTPVGGTVYSVGQYIGSTALNEIIYVGASAWANENQTGLTDNSTYNYAVYSYAGAGTQTNYSTALTGSQTTSVIPATTATAATEISTTGFTANWNAGAGETGYKLDVSTLSDFGNSSILSENFTGCSAGNKTTPDGTDISSTLDTKLQTTGWSGAQIYQAGGVIKLGSGSNQGYIITKALPLSTQNTSGIVDLSFDLQLYGSDANTSVQVFHASDGTTFTQLGSDLTATSSIVTVNIKISGATTTSKIKIAAKGTGNNRFFLDNIIFKQDISFVTSNENVSVSATNKAVTGLSPNTTYYYRVRATSANSTSPNSNVITAFTAINGTVSASTMPDCPTCDVIVATGGTLTVNANKTYNKVTVNPGGKLTLANGNTLTAPLTIESNSTNGTGTYVDENTGAGLPTITGTVQQWLTGKTGTSTRANWYLSSPVSEATTAVFDAAAGTNKITWYDEKIPNYVTKITDNTTTLVPGRGYVTYIGGGDVAYTFTGGTLNNGEITITPTRTGTDAPKRGFNLVGNPYPSYLNWDAAYADATNPAVNMRNAIWYRTYAGGAMTFHTYGDGDAVPETTSPLIAPMQGFWVKVAADNTNGSLTFKNTHRKHFETGANPLKVKALDARPRLRLVVSNGTATDEMLVVGKSYASDVLDSYDIEKMSNDNVAIPEVYSVVSNQELVINSMNALTEGKTVTLGFRPGQTGTNFTIEATQLENIDAKVMLLDKVAGTEQELTAGTPYSFEVTDATPTTDRFVISLVSKVPTGVQTGTASGDMTVYANRNNRIQVIYRGELNDQTTVSVYNVAGLMLSTQKLTKSSTELSGTFHPGVYMIQLNDGNHTITGKLIIR